MNRCPLPAHEWDLWTRLPATDARPRMLELGNKQGSAYKRYFLGEGLVSEHISVDLNGKDGALPLDLTQAGTLAALGRFNVVTNWGTTEHVTDQTVCWANIVAALRPAGCIVSTTPAPHHWAGHGMWYPRPEFFRELARLNGLTVLHLDTVTTRTGHRDARPMVRAILAAGAAPPLLGRSHLGLFKMPAARWLVYSEHGKSGAYG